MRVTRGGGDSWSEPSAAGALEPSVGPSGPVSFDSSRAAFRERLRPLTQVLFVTDIERRRSYARGNNERKR